MWFTAHLRPSQVPLVHPKLSSDVLVGFSWPFFFHFRGEPAGFVLKQYNAATTMLHCRYGDVLVKSRVVFAENIPFRIMTEKWKLGFILPQHIFPHFILGDFICMCFLCLMVSWPATLPHFRYIWRRCELVVTNTKQYNQYLPEIPAALPCPCRPLGNLHEPVFCSFHQFRRNIQFFNHGTIVAYFLHIIMTPSLWR